MIEKLKRDLAGRYEVAELPEKINEIIDFLNDTYLMKVKDGQTVCLDATTEAINTIPFVTGLCTTDDMVDKTDSITTCLNPDIKCPHCGASYYTILYSDSTAVYYPPIYKDGVNINPDHNTTTRQCECINCGKQFTI